MPDQTWLKRSGSALPFDLWGQSGFCDTRLWASPTTSSQLLPVLASIANIASRNCPSKRLGQTFWLTVSDSIFRVPHWWFAVDTCTDGEFKILDEYTPLCSPPNVILLLMLLWSRHHILCDVFSDLQQGIISHFTFSIPHSFLIPQLERRSQIDYKSTIIIRFPTTPMAVIFLQYLMTHLHCRSHAGAVQRPESIILIYSRK
jgi:hypothetical protein